MTGSPCWRRATASARRGSGHWRPPWSAAIGSWRTGTAGYSAPCRCSPGRSRWRALRRSPGRTPGRPYCISWTARCWSRRGLVPPRAAPDSRSRYVMLETLRAYGAGLLAETGESDAVAAALAGYALRVAEDAMSGLTAGTGEAAAARWLDAEEATTRQVLDWALAHDSGAGSDDTVAPRLAAALAWWWQLRGRLTA